MVQLQDPETSRPHSNEESHGNQGSPLAPSSEVGAAGQSRITARPSYVFLGVLAALVLVADAVTKWWAETTLSQRTLESPSIVLIDDVLTFTLAYNKGGAFGMFADGHDTWREPFFLLMSVGAVALIVSMYRKLHPEQNALRWGLPLVLGGALGNLADRIAKGKVVDFIDYRAGWVETMNELISKVNSEWHVTSHWPTFNVADMAICTGIGLMALDMFLNRNAPVSKQDGEGGAEPPSGAATGSAAPGDAPRASA